MDSTEIGKYEGAVMGSEGGMENTEDSDRREATRKDGMQRIRRV